MSKQKNTATVNASPTVNEQASPTVNEQPTQQPEQATEQQASPTEQQPEQPEQASPTVATVDSPTNSLHSVASLLTAYTSLTARDSLVADITARHAKVNAQITELELSDKQAVKLRAQYAISDSLENDLQAVNVDNVKATALTELKDASVDVWLSLVTELDQANSLLAQVNSLRSALGLQPFWLAHNGLLAKKSSPTRGQNGSEQHSTERAKYMRPGYVVLGHSGIEIKIVADVNTIVISGGGQSVEYKQGTTGVHSILKSFIQNTLGFSGSNMSTPEYLARFGYSKDDVYMLVQPDAATEKIKQPVKQAVK